MSDGSILERQYEVNLTVRPARTAAGDAFTDLVLEVAWLGGIFTAAGEALARTADQTLARWVILDAIEDQPVTVAQIARRRGIARQAVQRVADLLERDGLAAYAPNPKHRRAQLLRPTPRGREVLRTISVAQKSWADALGDEIGIAVLKRATTLVSGIRRTVSAREMPGRQPKRRGEHARQDAGAAT
jgi:DNA-binding MarR family transcriptional regulator